MAEQFDTPTVTLTRTETQPEPPFENLLWKIDSDQFCNSPPTYSFSIAHQVAEKSHFVILEVAKYLRDLLNLAVLRANFAAKRWGFMKVPGLINKF